MHRDWLRLVVKKTNQCNVVKDFSLIQLRNCSKIKMNVITYKLPIVIVIWILIGFISLINGAEFQCSNLFTNRKCINGTEISVGCKNSNEVDIFRLKLPHDWLIKCSGKTPLNQMVISHRELKLGNSLQNYTLKIVS